MVRSIVILMAASITLTGCQKAKMSKVEKKADPAPGYYAQNPPARYNPPPGQQQPPRTNYYPVQQQQQPPIHIQQQQQQNQGHVYIPPELPEADETPIEPRLPSPSDYEGEVNPGKQYGTRPNLDEANQVDYATFEKLPKVLDTCRVNCQVEDPPPEESCREGSKCKEDPAPGMCAPFVVKPETITISKKLDILFMVDSSKSMRTVNAKTNMTELENMARQMKSFVRQLDAGTQYNVSVMLAHGPGGMFHGKLYARGKKDPVVIKFAKHLKAAEAKGLKGEAARREAEETVIELLAQKMRSIDVAVNDRTDAQGEAGMLNLYKTLTTDQLRRDLEDAGAIRKDAALDVIFVSDENDACFDYKKFGVTPRVEDKHEVATFNSVCQTGSTGQLTEDDVLEALLKVKGEQPLIVSAVVYTDAKTLPALGPNDENEQGWGYANLVQKAHGTQEKEKGPLADLGKKDFGKNLAQIGSFVETKMRYGALDRFDCHTNSRRENIRNDSFDIVVNGANGRLAHFSAMCPGTNCPKGAKPITVYSSDDKGLPFTFMPTQKEVLEIFKKAGKDGFTVETSFLKIKEDGVAAISQEFYPRGKSKLGHSEAAVNTHADIEEAYGDEIEAVAEVKVKATKKAEKKVVATKTSKPATTKKATTTKKTTATTTKKAQPTFKTNVKHGVADLSESKSTQTASTQKASATKKSPTTKKSTISKPATTKKTTTQKTTKTQVIKANFTGGSVDANGKHF